MQNRFVRACAAAALLVLAAACGTVQVRVPVMRPAEINMSSYHSIGIGGMTGQQHDIFASALEEQLVKSGQFQVVDRSHLDRVMKELQLSASDLADPNKSATLGKQITANALIFGTVDEKYREEPKDESWQDNKGVRHVLHRLHGEVKLTASFKITDVSTGTLIVAKTYDEVRDDDSTGVDERPKPIDRDALAKQARASAVKKFMRAIVPHKEYVDANFLTEGDLPQLETAIGYAKRGDWKKAQDLLNQTIADAERNPKIDSKKLGKAYWDLALCYEYAGDYDKALATVDKAYQLTQEQDMLAEQDNIKRLQEESKKLAEQGPKPEANNEAVREHQ